jgi:hypothetical protein
VIYAFIQDWRMTLVPMITIPVSLIGTFALMKALGASINTLTLFGLTLATGLVVDDAILVIENIARFVQEKKIAPFDCGGGDARNRRRGRRDIARTARRIHSRRILSGLDGLGIRWSSCSRVRESAPRRRSRRAVCGDARRRNALAPNRDDVTCVYVRHSATDVGDGRRQHEPELALNRRVRRHARLTVLNLSSCRCSTSW